MDNVDDLFKFEKRITNEILVLKTVRFKTKTEYFLFIPPETTQLILAYLKERCNNKEIKNQCINTDETLFINDQGNPMSSKDISTYLQKVVKNSDFEVSKNGIFSHHSLRKYFTNIIINNIQSKKCINSILGYNIEEDIISLKKEYLKALPSLSLETR